MFDHSILDPIHAFLAATTPDEWLDEARKPENLPILLRDHLLCELKAARNALFLIRRYAVDQTSRHQLQDWIAPYEHFAYSRMGDMQTLKTGGLISRQISARDGCNYSQDMIDKMVMLIREELHHFYQVLEVMEQKGIPYQSVAASRYARGMTQYMKTHEPDALVDKLIIGAFIEARSCERFARLAPHLEEDVGKFYISLLRSEARHYQDYLALAEQIAGKDITARVAFFAQTEAQLITSPDNDFKFHSGKPAFSTH
ncbi:tRNA isopentenyl-2-thiomethyl-A-37 hydroxylase MiaE [Dickeya solani]|uniref:tRNA isopentenyl-2-thiomethyl-A-37 hydroxylase MiaE n=2 Tax=Dickeya solani TaxID=1089444 RepID=A0AAP8Q7C6_9GAMM|nr:tRNA isopentenyl-2-thiomethyl-A-37 hydroxylase MiaE [Dickeya solani]ANE76466.1 tRNA-(ms[2]io[6]A)-hydroxylase [Dickeya solani IPO 2222]AUC44091.1 tRNA-(ms2io6A)-hydroxylase [Dickeya solani RNS 08.23.3.1.A]AUH08122.1 tRNA-(ms[2]io[6]A)-hydroxylase [Dickeya solani D s0432-1]AUH12137.1 tRNA-(ms[2]io[6]A)-hydroxylase [Dickeya solani]AYQ46960.1 tRNA-(MS(2)IO(6)A)-hydroxylase (MiaE) [Dickeya solani]